MERLRINYYDRLSLIPSLVVALVGFGSIAEAETPADEPPLELTAAHLDLNREEILAIPAEVTTVVDKAAVDVEKAEPDAVEAEALPPETNVSPIAADTPVAVNTYERCLEISIRAQNGFDESSRVCRALFPGW